MKGYNPKHNQDLMDQAADFLREADHKLIAARSWNDGELALKIKLTRESILKMAAALELFLEVKYWEDLNNGKSSL